MIVAQTKDSTRGSVKQLDLGYIQKVEQTGVTDGWDGDNIIKAKSEGILEFQLKIVWPVISLSMGVGWEDSGREKCL